MIEQRLCAGSSRRNARKTPTHPAARKTHTNLGAQNARAKAATRKSRAKQGELAFSNWGGARKGAGRKPKGERARNPHRPRPEHKERFPVLVTTRLCAGLGSLRKPGEAARVRAALILANERGDAAAPDKENSSAGFQVVHHSIQSNHLHLIVEASDRRALTRGIQGLLIRIARALNRLWGRQGTVFADRFHEHELRTPREVRNALVYVLQNLRKHGIRLAGPDPYSSGPEFDGWSMASWGARSTGDVRAPGAAARPARLGGDSRAPVKGLRQAMRAPVPGAKSYLLGSGWMRHGPIDPEESPRRGGRAR